MTTETVSQVNSGVEVQDQKPASDPTFRQNILLAAEGGSISFAGRTFEYLVRFIFSIIVANSLGAEQYGLYTLVLTVVPIASMLALLGLQTGVVHFLPPAIRQNDEKRIWGIIQVSAGLPILLSVLFGAAIFLLAEPIALIGFHQARLVPLLRIVSLSIPLEAIGFIAYQIIISYKKPQYSVIANNIVLPVMKLLLTVGFLALGLGITGLVSAHVLATALGVALILYFLNSLFPLHRPLQPAVRNTTQLLRYSLPVHLGWVFNTIRGTLETLILGFVGLTSGVGIFAVAQRLSSLGSMLFLAVGNISTPIIADYYHRREIGELNRLYQTTTKWIVTFNIPLFLTFVIFARPLLSIFGGDFIGGSAGLVVLAVGNLVYTGTGIGANILDMTNHTRFNSANSVFMVIVTIASDLLLIPRWGVIGAASAAAFSTVIVNIVCLVEVFILLKMQPYGTGIFKPVLAGCITAAVTYMLDRYLPEPFLLHLLAGGLILWGLYTLIMILLRFSDDDMLVIRNFRNRIRSMVRPKRVAVE